MVGACIGTDAHTVGIDAILNVKGHAGEKGLEYYREIRVVNLGAQVEVPRLVARAAAEGADAVLVSQVVTQRDAHLSGARELAAAFDAAAARARRRPAAAGRRRPPVRPGRRRRAGRRQGLRPGHHAPRGGQLPGLEAGPRAGRAAAEAPVAGGAVAGSTAAGRAGAGSRA